VHRITSAHLLAALALVVAMSGTATAASLITSRDIKNNTITSADVKNGALRLKDVKKSDVAALVGPAGPAGASAFAPPPSGTVVTGGDMVDTASSPATMRAFTSLGFPLAAPLVDTGPGRNLAFGVPYDATQMGPGTVDTVSCAGTASAPSPAPGFTCLYPVTASNLVAGSVTLVAGFTTSAEAGDRLGFVVRAVGQDPGSAGLRYVWAYRAP
jgi:hypothetical protein